MSDPIWDEWKQGREMLKQMAIPTPPASDPLLARLEEELRLAGLRIQLAKDAYKADKTKANWQAVGHASNDASAIRRVIGLLAPADKTRHK